ncbi:MAG TPA: FMN-binding protein [Phycisphaerae bacterium]|nr:FMN-binding protein [Phycisphaerae bacterium]HPS52779.1 FMN-binding protein [Phycisphaerae bacterium]
MLKYFKQGWLVIAISLAFGALLAGVQLTLGPKIKENQITKSYNRIPLLLLGQDKVNGAKIVIAGDKITVDRDGKAETTLTVQKPENPLDYDVYKVFNGDKQLGWVVLGKGNGYADEVVCLIGLSPDLKTITGVSVISQKETPNLGSKIQSPWIYQFAGKAANPPLEVVKNRTASPDNNKIDAISGATISSDSLTAIVNQTVAKFVGDVEKLKFASAAAEEK